MSFAIDDFLLDGIEPESSEPGCWYVRIKPYNPALGHKLRSANLRSRKLRFDGAKGWNILKTMDRELLEELAMLRQEPGNESTPLALDICTKEEALALEEAETRRRKAAQRKRAAVEDAGVLRSEHLSSTRSSRHERLLAARDLREAERIGDVALAARRRSPEPRSAEEIDAEIKRLEAMRGKLAPVRAERAGKPQHPAMRGRGASKPGPKPKSRGVERDDDELEAIGD